MATALRRRTRRGPPPGARAEVKRPLMIRRSILPRASAVVLLVLFAVAAPTPSVRSQDRALQDRLDRLERDLSMLQRQVYHGGSGAAVSAGSSGAVDTELRMDRLETQMRELTGRVEDAANGVEQLRRRVEQINSDIDVRFGQGQAGPTSAPPPPRGPDRTAVATAAAGSLPMRASPTGNPPPPSNATPAGTLAPPPAITAPGPGTLTPPGPARLAPDPKGAAATTSFHSPSSGAL